MMLAHYHDSVHVVWCGSDNGNAQEAHAEDHCLLSTTPALIDGVAQTTLQFVCEYELTCWHGWSQYTDGGAEGSDSCLFLSTSTAASWSAAAAGCRSNSHLISSVSTSSSSGVVSSVRSTVVSQAGGFAYYGCSQSSSAATVFTGWTWLDGTPSNNINCAGAGCSVWATGQPE